MKRLSRIVLATLAVAFFFVSNAMAQFPGMNQNPAMSQGMPNLADFKPVQSPQWLMPLADMQVEKRDTAVVDIVNMQFAWTPVVVQFMGQAPQRVTYSIKIVRSLPNMPVDDAINRCEVVFQTKNLMNTTYIMPLQKMKSELREGETYIAEIRASLPNMSKQIPLSKLIQNEGRSNLLIFRIKNNTADNL